LGDSRDYTALARAKGGKEKQPQLWDVLADGIANQPSNDREQWIRDGASLEPEGLGASSHDVQLFRDDRIQLDRGDLGSQGAPNLLNCPNTVTGILAMFWDMPLSKMKLQCVDWCGEWHVPELCTATVLALQKSQLSASFLESVNTTCAGRAWFSLFFFFC
jgi:hypothetical protein